MSKQPKFASSKRARLYTRKFDYEEARRRRQAGESITALAREYGVSTDGIPGTRAILADVSYGSVVKCEGRWGVVEDLAGAGRRAIHYWDGPSESLPTTTVVDVAPSHRVFVDSVEQDPEMVA